MLITTRHLFTIPGFSTRPGFCRAGARQWCVRHGVDWDDFARNGIDAEMLVATGDGFALALVAWAEQCAAEEQQTHG